MTDSLARLIGKQPFYGYRFEGVRYDCGDKVGFIQATIAYALAREDMGADVADHIRALARTL